MNFDTSTVEAPDQTSVSDPGLADSFGQGRKIKTTRSICPHCLEPVKAQVLERANQVWMDKTCARHGRFSALLASDVRHYFESTGYSTGGKSCCGNGCGVPARDVSPGTEAAAPWSSHSCNILIEITERCNLSCPTCFAASSPQNSKMLSLEEFTRQVDQLVAGGKRDADLIQLSGGEPTIHPQFFAMIDVLFQRGFNQVCINTNGLKLSRPDFARRLANYQQKSANGKVFVYLQFDGFEDNTQMQLRGRSDLLDIKRKALANCQANGILVHPVMTLTRNLNEHEVGNFVQLGADNPALRNIVFQPAMYSGRYDNPRRQDRITLADTVAMIASQFGVFSAQDFVPIPCSDPNCFGMAVAIRTRQGLLPVSRYFPRYETWDSPESRDFIDSISDTINGPQAISEAIRWATSDEHPGRMLDDLDDAGVEQLLDALIEIQSSGSRLWDKLLTISIKPFMDAWTYDQDRIDVCCVHILDKAGNPVSFCEYNAINRPRMQAAK